MKRPILSICLLLFLPMGEAAAVKPVLYKNSDAPECRAWVDSVMATLDRPARVAQLFMPVVSSHPGNGWPERIVQWTETLGVGGLFFDRGTAPDQAQATRLAQSHSRVPLLVGADAEWGLAMRLEGTPVFPHNTLLGAVADTSLIKEYGLEMARQCREMGIQVSFAPVADVNSNPANPVIGTRSFGADPEAVAVRASAYAAGLEQGGVLSVMKHFPGHGNTREDSHEQLAHVSGSRAQMEAVELVPFRRLIADGRGGLMVGHLSVPAYEKDVRLPSSQSPAIVDTLLRQTLGFEGLVFTDALVMKGSASAYSGANCIRSLQAGNDVLLSPANLAGDLRAVVAAVEKGLLSDSLIDAKCRKVLTYKYLLGLSRRPAVDTVGLSERLSTPRTRALIHRLYTEGITLLRNDRDCLPLRHLESNRTAVVLLGRPVEGNPFVARLKDYQETVDAFSLSNGENAEALMEQLDAYDRVVVAVYGNTRQQCEWTRRLSAHRQAIFCFFASPYTLENHGRLLEQAPAVVLSYEATDDAQDLTAQLVFGGIPARGVLPAPIGRYYPLGYGLQTQKTRLAYGVPEEAGMQTEVLQRIDSIVDDALECHAFPGCQVLVARHGTVVWNRAYGWTDADVYRRVRTDDVYDLASVTKAVVTAPAVMAMCEQGKIYLDEPVSDQLPALRGTDKQSATYRQMLYHEAQLAPFVPFYQSLIDTASYPSQRFLTYRPDSVHTLCFDESAWAPAHFSFYSDMVSSSEQEPFRLQVAENMYVNTSFRDSVTAIICRSDLLRRKRYTYSDLGYILMGFAVENVQGIPLDGWAEQELFAPLGACTSTYLPLRKLPLDRIIPTALDTALRHQLVHGYPHDEAAAFLGGVSGNAGLFSSANDLAKLLQMMLEQGTYGGHRFYEPATLRYFTGTRSKLSRRMLGYDAYEPNPARSQPVCPSASPATYGHIGFTGTCFWVDPINDMVYIFLSNRVHPDRTNTLLSRMDIRPKIQQVLYESFE